MRSAVEQQKINTLLNKGVMINGNNNLAISEISENNRITTLAIKWFNGLTESEKNNIFDKNTLTALKGESLPKDLKIVMIRNRYLEVDTTDELDAFNKFRYNFEYKLKTKSGAFSGYLAKTKDVSVDRFIVQHMSKKFKFLVTKTNDKFWLSKLEGSKNKVTQIYNILDMSSVEKILNLHNLNYELNQENGKTFEIV